MSRLGLSLEFLEIKGVDRSMQGLSGGYTVWVSEFDGVERIVLKSAV